MVNLFNGQKIRTWLLLTVLAAASFAIFWQALRHGFLINWDDRQYILDNPIIRGFTLDHLKNAFTTFYIGNYAPLHLVSYMLDYEVWGMRASGFILTNILLHTMNTLLFFHLLKKTAGDKVWIFPAALIFLLHPVQVESVVWVSQRKNLLAMSLFLIAIYLYREYKTSERKHAVLFYLFSLSAFLLALLAKSVVVILPLVLLLYDFSYLKQRDFKSLLIDKLPFAIIALVFCLVAIKSQSAQFQGGKTSWHGGSPYATFLTMLPVIVAYLRMLAWPANLSAFYDVPIKKAIDSEVALAAAVCLILIFVGIALYRRRHDLFYWYALFFIGLVPVSQIVPIVTLMNDRYLYFPMLGAAAWLSLIAFGDMEWCELSATPKTAPVSLFFLVMTVCLAVVSFQRVGVWQNSATLWEDAAKKAPGIPLTHDSYGEGLLEQGKIDDAVREFNIALTMEPDMDFRKLDIGSRSARANTRNNLGTAYGIKGMTEAAIEQFKIAIQLNPDFAKAYYNMGNGLMNKGLVFQALQCFETAARLEPGNPAFAANLRLTREIADEQKQTGNMKRIINR